MNVVPITDGAFPARQQRPPATLRARLLSIVQPEISGEAEE
jgi:hypothetical protein